MYNRQTANIVPLNKWLEWTKTTRGMSMLEYIQWINNSYNESWRKLWAALDETEQKHNNE